MKDPFHKLSHSYIKAAVIKTNGNRVNIPKKDVGEWWETNIHPNVKISVNNECKLNFHFYGTIFFIKIPSYPICINTQTHV